MMYFILNDFRRSISQSKNCYICVSPYNFINFLDKKHFFGFDNWQLSHFGFCERNKLCVGAGDEHPNEEGHKVIADYFLKEIEKEYGNL